MRVCAFLCLCVCVCVCEWVYLGSSPLFKYVWLDIKDTFCLYDFIRILSSFSVFIFFFIVVNLSFYKTTPILSCVSIVVSGMIMYFIGVVL